MWSDGGYRRMTIRIALDFDGVLADLHWTVQQKTTLKHSDFDTWLLDNGPKLDLFLDRVEDVWDYHASDVPPVDPDIDEHVETLSGLGQIDIVTNTCASDETVEWWLSEHGIEYGTHYNGIVRAHEQDKEKRELEQYNMFIDDNPNMAYDVDLLYLIDRPYTPDDIETYVIGDVPCVTHTSSNVVARAGGLDDVIQDIRDRQVFGLR